MSAIVRRLAATMSKEEQLAQDWQFALARRVAQILEQRSMTQREFAQRARLTDAQVSAILHGGANPTLGVLARIAALLDVEILTWVNSDVQASRRRSATPEPATRRLRSLT
jgi:transcriptional regulator with XRE-family HTH domain